MTSHKMLCVCVMLLAACGGGGVSDSVTPPAPPDTTNNGGTVQRTSLTVRVQVDAADANIASAAGISLSGLTVRLTRQGVNEAPRTGTTDTNGSVRFDALLDGIYSASVERKLTDTELARLSPTEQDASVFAGGASAVVSPPNAQTSTVSLVAARRGLLVISEVFNYSGFPIPYNWASYIEIYNNGDATEYLDGMYLTRTPALLLHTATFADCGVPEFEPYRSDTTRIWVEGGLRFPGAGQQYPVPPGESRVYATDALDHRVASGSLQFADLSMAQFEHVATAADTDNPFAVNMLPVFGTTSGSGSRGVQAIGRASWVLVRAAAQSQLSTVILDPIDRRSTGGVPFTPQQIWGIPRGEVVDVFSMDMSTDYKAYLATTTFRYTQCQPWLPSVFERAPAEVYDPTYRPGAIRRRSLGQSANGREILMRTRTSARDLEITNTLLQRSLNR